MPQAPWCVAIADMDVLRRYHHDTRDIWNSVLLVLPLVILYQVGLLVAGGVRNGVDFVTDALLGLAGGHVLGYVALTAFLAATAFGVALGLSHQGQRPFRRRLFAAVLIESFLYAGLMGSAILQVLSYVPGLEPSLSTAIQDSDLLTRVVLSIGAGVHEELVFRLFLFGGLVLVATRWLRWSLPHATVLAIVVSSLLFASVHYVGPLADPFTAFSFSFRFFAGAIFAGIFALRSFAVAVYTHALYDVLVLVF